MSKDLKFIIGVDCEGPAAVVGSRSELLSTSPNFQLARLQATRETDAAAKALFEAGASQVIVWDNHGGGVNLIYDDLDERCDLILGSGYSARWPTLDRSFAGVLMVGYHSMATTIDGVLAHSFNSTAYQWIKVNDVEVGEIEIDAGVAGESGVPLIFVASDAAGTAEAKRFLPHIETVSTKVGLGWNAALSKHPKRVAREVYDGVRAAVARLGQMKTFTFETPLTLELRFCRAPGAESTARSLAGWERPDAYTVRRQLARISDFPF